VWQRHGYNTGEHGQDERRQQAQPGSNAGRGSGTRDRPEAAGFGMREHPSLDLLKQAGRQDTTGNVPGTAGNGPEIGARPYKAVELAADNPDGGTSMSLKKADRVKHPAKAEWGLGEVLEDSNGETVRVFFVGAGEKTLSLKHVTLNCIPTDEAAHPMLDNLRVPEKRDRHRYQSLPESIERFLERYPKGFYDDRFTDEERDYKVRAHQIALSLLSQRELAHLLSVNDCAEVCRRAVSVAYETNLIFPNEKMALRDGLQLPAHQQAFAAALYNLLYGDDDLQPRFETYADVLEGISAAKWTIATYFLFMVYPEEHMFLKPIVTQKTAAISRFEINYRPDLNWRTYKSVLAFGNYLKAELVGLLPRDMIDVQSFMWCISPGKQ
jgi:hypothetical protein